MKKLRVKKLQNDAVLPKRSYAFDAGLDLFSLEDKFIPVGETCKINTGIAVDINPGYYAQIHDRSSLASKGLRVGAGVVDHGYQGELCVVLHNISNKSDYEQTFNSYKGYQIKKGDKIAQIVIHKIELPEVVEVDSLSPSERGTSGFGSTGR